MVAEDAELVIEQPPPYVSRGGVKLANALDALGIDVARRSCLDVGASTGGFTDCLLQRGATRVVALDVGRGQLDWGLRNDPRVHVVERRNARELRPPSYRSRLIWRRSTSPSSRWPRCCRRLRAAWRRAASSSRWSSPSSSSGAAGSERAGSCARAEDRREALCRGRRGRRGRWAWRCVGFASSGLPGPKGNRESFVWCATEARGSTIEAAAREVEP